MVPKLPSQHNVCEIVALQSKETSKMSFRKITSFSGRPCLLQSNKIIEDAPSNRRNTVQKKVKEMKTSKTIVGLVSLMHFFGFGAENKKS